MNYVKLLEEANSKLDHRDWDVQACGVVNCNCRMIIPLPQNNDEDYITPAGCINNEQASYLTLIHHTIPKLVQAGSLSEVSTSTIHSLLHWDKKLDVYKRKWRYVHCFAVKKGKQDDCWCRVIIPVGRMTLDETIYDAIQVNKQEARLIVLMHNYLIDGNYR